jgi:hypothetical protein
VRSTYAMSFSFMSGWKERLLDPVIDARMRQAGIAGVEEARRLVPVRTGKLRDSIGYIYNQQTKTLTLYADQPYASFIELGTRRIAARPFLRPALAAMGRTWGGTTEVQFTGLASKYHERTVKFSGGKVGRSKLILGHKRPKR